ncbi:HIT family protein [Marinobacter sp. C2H3]|uniref:HIT family protein n=1 Tax=Marinobacter sp. C2H3 TaxID=3119003 RepID=UPI00300E946D
MSDFVIHERLARDTHLLGRSQLCEVRLMNDCTWPWVLLVPSVPGIREIYELSPVQQQRLLLESSRLGEGMMALFGGDKLNLAALGNMVPQLHLHHIVRFQDDPAWPGPVWGVQPPVPYGPEALAAVRDTLAPLVASLAD